jgi:hypothetical protein
MRNLFILFIIVISATHFAVSQPVISKKKFHLYLLAGQSNMAGRGTVEQDDKTTHPRIWMLNKNNQWELAIEPLHFDKPSVVGVGPGFSFAKEMAKKDTNIVIGLIPCAVGGSPISVWEAAKYYEPTKSYPYDDAIKRTKIAMQKGTLKGILWQQGESDSDSVKATFYDKKLETLVKKFRKEFKVRSLPFVAGKIADFYIVKHPYAQVVNKAIEKSSQNIKNTAFVSSADLKHKGDETYFDSQSARELGKRFAEVFQKINSKKLNGKYN